jgi:hypothetical protein
MKIQVSGIVGFFRTSLVSKPYFVDPFSAYRKDAPAHA